jgi:hypothetical protein
MSPTWFACPGRPPWELVAGERCERAFDRRQQLPGEAIVGCFFIIDDLDGITSQRQRACQCRRGRADECVHGGIGFDVGSIRSRVGGSVAWVALAQLVLNLTEPARFGDRAPVPYN